MKITDKILSIPPYLSTPWSQIASLQSRATGSSYTLIVTLKSNLLVEVPGLDPTSLEQIFEAHTRHTESESPFASPIHFKLPIQPDGSLSSALQHNPEQSDLPDMPPEVLDRMTTIGKAFGLEDTSALPAPESNCNCIYCQVVRALGTSPQVEEDLVTEADLHFRDWEVKQTAPNLYTVTNPLDAAEHYTVFLGTPIGCTCGQTHCEHIKATLSS
jgi:hypothetical protein